jgi:hypothetical protein
MTSALCLNDGEAFTSPHYHPAVAGPDDVFRGMTWRQMPGSEAEVKRMNFFLFRRGLYDIQPAGTRDVTRVFHGSRKRSRKSAGAQA